MNMEISKLYGLYVHNHTNGKVDNRAIALDAVYKFLTEKPPFKHMIGDVIAVLPNDEIASIMSAIFETNGFIVHKIDPNRLYRLRDNFIVHYIMTNNFNIELDEVDKYINKWELDHKVTKQDMRTAKRYFKVFFID